MFAFFNKNISMKKVLGIFAVSLFLVSLNPVKMLGGPASNEVFVASQPDGTTLDVRMHGDEFSHYTTTADGILIIENHATGFYYFAHQNAEGRVEASTIRATDIGKRNAASQEYIRSLDNEGLISSLLEQQSSAGMNEDRLGKRGPGLFADATFPTTGKQKAIVILVEYKDVKFRISDPYDYFHRLLNQEGFSDYNSTGSARDYYLKSSEGAFDIDFDVYGPVTLPNNQAYYGSNGFSGKDGINASLMVVDACNILDKDIDFSQYDRDNDGVIDNVFLFYAGVGEDSGGGSDAVWPHSADAPRGYAYDGKNLQSYGCTSEWVPRPTGSRPDGIGAFCHEFGHVLGLPDLYKTANASTEPFTPGSWSLMDRGAHNNERRTPPALDLFSRYALGWWEPQILDSPKTCVLNPFNISGEGYLIPTGNDNDFYLIENRQRTGWDLYLPGHGLLVWHIDYDPGVWSRFAVNNDASHQHVDIIEADGILTEDTRSGDSFPGAANVTSLTSELYPLLATENTITDITEYPDGTVSFKFRGGSPAPEPVTALEPTEITPRSFTAKWNHSDKATDYRLRIYSLNSDGTEEEVPGYEGRLTGMVTELAVNGLQPETDYYYTVKVMDGATESISSPAVKATTLPISHAYMIPTANEASEVTSGSFTASWQPVEGADSYTITVKEVKFENVTTLTEAFDDKVMTWNSNSDKFYANTSYTGAKAPSLKLSDGNYVCTPVLPRGTIRSFSFWHRASTADNSSISIEAYAHGCWQRIREITPITTKGGATTTIYEFPDQTDAVRIILSDKTGTASVFTDDFSVVTSTDISVRVLPDYTDAVIGNSLSYNVSGLQPDTHYIFTMNALKGAEKSMDSNPIHLTTKRGETIEYIEADCFPVVFKMHGNNVLIEASPATEVLVYNINGLLITNMRTEPDGCVAFRLPAQGIYVIKVGQEIFKAAAK